MVRLDQCQVIPHPKVRSAAKTRESSPHRWREDGGKHQKRAVRRSAGGSSYMGGEFRIRITALSRYFQSNGPATSAPNPATHRIHIGSPMHGPYRAGQRERAHTASYTSIQPNPMAMITRLQTSAIPAPPKALYIPVGS